MKKFTEKDYADMGFEPIEIRDTKETKLTLEQAVEKGKAFIDNYHWACVCQATSVMQFIAKARADFENGLIRDYGEDFAFEYFNAINAA